jgi:Fic family protein
MGPPGGAREEWPGVGFDERAWESSDTRIPRRHQLSHRGPYRAAVPATIAVTDPRLALALLGAVDEATAELARFDAEAGGDLAPFSALLLRSEAAASSQIENLTASAKAIAAAELGPAKRNASIIVANTRAMQAALALADHLDAQAIIDMHEVLLTATHPEWTGHFRDKQVWIGGTTYGPHEAHFVPPHHERVPAAIDDLVAFLARDDLPVLVQAALAHAQFETIHPFPDGNGRVGRALVQALLRAKHVTQTVTVPISAGLLTDRDTYFDALDAYRSGKIDPIVEAFADAAFRAVVNGRELVTDLRSVTAAWRDEVHARRDAAAWGLLELLTRQPVVTTTLVQEALNISPPAARGAIEQLVEAGILTQSSGDKRYRQFAAAEVLEALDAFAQRAGRRQQ